MTQEKRTGTSRRDFLATTAVGTAALASNLSSLSNVHAAGDDVIRIGLVGCGGRGTGAAEQCLRADPNVKLVALGDTFRDRIVGTQKKVPGCLDKLKNNKQIINKIDVPEDRIFVGLDAYKKVIENVDLVLLATPPGFRPLHIEAAIEAKKHLFTEKPVGVDAPGIRRVLEAYKKADANNLSVVAGTQRRYQNGYVESMKKIQDGDLGTVTSARCYWNQGGLWHKDRQKDWSDLEYHIRNWLYLTYLSGDHIVEQHVHNIDVARWAMGNAVPVRCMGMGGREVRTGNEYGHIFDHFAIDYEFPNGVHVLSMCRQINGCAGNVSEAVSGTKGHWYGKNNGTYRINDFAGKRIWSFSRRDDNQPYLQEHVELIKSVRGKRPRLNDLKNVAESTMTAIMGRMSAYTGRALEWDEALGSKEVLMPEKLSFDMKIPIPPVAIPGQTPFI